MDDAAASPARARPAFLSQGFAIAAGAILIVGAVLRIYGAQGELWLDEIWSLDVIRESEMKYGFLWGLTIDNNHYLNTLYLYLVGPDASALMLRSLSILLGTLSIAAAGWAMRRSGPAAALAAMAIFAVAYPMVNYGSEARGYSGMILMTVLGIALVEEALRDARRAWPVLLGLVAAAGFLFQPIMALSLGVLGIWAGWVAWRTTRSLRQMEGALFRIFLPSAILLLAIVAVLLVAIGATGGYQFGGKTPFRAAGFVQGYGGLLDFMLGLPDFVPPAAALLIIPVLPLIALAWRNRLSPYRVSFSVIAIAVVPAIFFCMQPPNVEFPRYYLASGIAILLLLADLFGAAWRSARGLRALAVALALLFVAGHGAMLLKFYHYGRGHVTSALQVIAADQDPRVLMFNAVRDEAVIDYFTRHLDLPVQYVAKEALCRERPSWLLSSQKDRGPDIAAVTEPGCTVLFRRIADSPAWGLSGARWILYRIE